MATHSSILAWKIPWTEKLGGLQSMGLQSVGQGWVTNHIHILYSVECACIYRLCMYPYIKQNIYIYMYIYTHTHTHTSVYSIQEQYLWSQRIIFHYWNGFCKAQISSHPEEATYSDLFSCTCLVQTFFKTTHKLFDLPTLFQWQIFHRLLNSTSFCFSLPINTIRIMMEPIMGPCQESGSNN